MTATETHVASIKPQSAQRFGWAFYLATSWTWCIGMFLPVLLVRDYGVASWFIFAIPNCVGAAAMGWVVRDGQMSREIVRRHRAMTVAFSVVTCLFQAFFLGWMGQRLFGFPILLLGYAALIAMALALRTNAVIGAVAIWFVSLGLWIAAIRFGWVPHLPPPKPLRFPDLGGLAMVCLLGFGACPYLDLTFHHARQQSDRDGRAAFGVGFLLLFAMMILFTLGYSGWLGRAGIAIPTGLAIVLAIHWTIQCAFTTWVHLDAARLSVGAAALGLLFAGALGAVSDHVMWHRLSGGEIGYRTFMAFYGLIFPAYVWIRIVPRPRPAWVAIAAMLVALPFYAMAFLGGAMAWAAIGVAAAAAARWIVPGKAAAPVSNLP